MFHSAVSRAESLFAHKSPLITFFSSSVFLHQIFTNADKAHATRTLNRLGLEDCFEGIICFETLNPSSNTTTQILCKPSVQAFEAAIRIADIVDPRKTVKENVTRIFITVSDTKNLCFFLFRCSLMTVSVTSLVLKQQGSKPCSWVTRC